ncbi:MAG: tetratricopeptide repeat protein [Frankiales bacterium]|nr:MAG: tetratricopeptide repeat protein [Frankiales bacterium]
MTSNGASGQDTYDTFRQGELFLRAGQPTEAALRRLVERRPDDGWAWFALARTMERRGSDATQQRRVAAALGFEG